MTNKFVGMQICPYCKEPMGILIQQNLREIPDTCCTGPEPCDNCKKKFKADGAVPVWEVRNPGKPKPDYTGRYVFFRREAVKDPAMIKMMEELGFLMCDESVIDTIPKPKLTK